ncbi:MAG TPA: hypothetical protein VHC69_10905 [Polyangiaceae bacterium]|nr:hypothetical protein [Polyangiaceae bacterium]
MRGFAWTLVGLLASAGCGSVDSAAQSRLFGNNGQSGETASGGQLGGGGTSSCEGGSCGGAACADPSAAGCSVTPTTPPCAASQKACSDLCVDPSPANGCGDPACAPCPQIANSQAACRGDDCGFDCDPGYVQDGPSACVQPPPACTDGVKNGDETDTDCGGSCPRCAGGGACNHGADCLSAACVNGVCATPSCTNGVQDSMETDIDCGGPACPPCQVGLRCRVGSDCADMACTGGTCRASTCADRTKNGDETSIDCGGSCGPCPLNATCLTDADCTSGHCAANICRQPCPSPGSSDGCPACAQGESCCNLSQFCGCSVLVRNSPLCL